MSLQESEYDDGFVRIDYKPRAQFIPFHERKERWACIVAHRRAGKTVACIHDLQRRALQSALERPRFAYIAPTYAQAKSAAFDYLREAAGPIYAYGAKANISELRLDYPNGSQVRLFGADNYDALRGLRLDGVVLDEFADFDPRAWPEVIRPALSDRKGYAVFIGTPKGHNSFYDVAKRARIEPDWFYLELKASETAPLNDRIPNAERFGLVTSDELESARRDMTEDQYNQEYECSFEAAIVGAYYGKLINEAEQDKRITGVPYDPNAQVYTSWDLGFADATAIWFAQIVGKEIHLIDYYENSGADLGHYVNVLQNRRYVYAGHIVPFDAQAKEIGTGKNRIETLQNLGLRSVRVAPSHRKEDGINAVRLLLPRCWFDAKKCDRGLEALKMYHSEWDEKLKALKASPVHDWASHGADSFRYLAMTLDNINKGSFRRKLPYKPLGLW